MTTRNLLIEIGTEELPPKALPKLSSAFSRELASLLGKAELAFKGITAYATPRRLALLITDLETRQPDLSIEKFGPAVQAAFDADGNATKAAEGFARSCGVAVSELAEKQDGKATKLFFSSSSPGKDTTDLLPDMVKSALAALPIPKRMRWGSSRDEFVRPVHWAILLFGEEVITTRILGVDSSNITYGHRFHQPQPITISCPENYEQRLLEEGKVIADFDKRRETIRTLIELEGQKLKARTIIDENLLNEVTALVEWPVALAGNFDTDFLAVPKEALISSLKEHQKCFYLLDDNDNILPNFITVSNLESTDPSKVIAGNEKVIRPRLADAAFFFNQDKKSSLFSRQEKLKTVVFQQELGTVYEKSLRVASLAKYIATQLGFNDALAHRAAMLGKCDLLTSMVYEFAELQGIMGYYYALNDGEDEQVALALNEQYLPKFAGDALPESETGIVLALAERLDTMVGMFGIGQPPTGSKDPFALRRAALGILRIIIEKRLPFDLSLCLANASSGFTNLPDAEGVEEKVSDFIFERLRSWYADQGVSAEIFLAVDTVRSASPLDFDARIQAVNSFIQLKEAESLAAANKRVSNILAKVSGEVSDKLDNSLLTEPAEIELARSLEEVHKEVNPLLTNRDYTAALAAMGKLQSSIDAFFENVMVNTDDQAIRNNRLALLQQLRKMFLGIADISLLQST